MLHLYALTPHPARLANVAGIDGSDLRIALVDDLVDAVVSELPAGPVQATEPAILAHAAVIEELAAVNEALLPARFGPGYAEDEAIAAAVAARKGQLREALERVRGCVELGLRVLDAANTEESANGSSGRAYMLRRLETIQKGERLAAEVHAALAANARDSTSRVLASPQLLLSAAYLLPRDELDSFRSAVDELEGQHPELTFVCTGPWPPYSFALVDGETA
jgi:hypothetical protein